MKERKKEKEKKKRIKKNGRREERKKGKEESRAMKDAGGRLARGWTQSTRRALLAFSQSWGPGGFVPTYPT